MSGGQDARRERPAMGMGSPEPGANREHTQVDNLCYVGTQVDNLCYEEAGLGEAGSGHAVDDRQCR